MATSASRSGSRGGFELVLADPAELRDERALRRVAAEQRRDPDASTARTRRAAPRSSRSPPSRQKSRHSFALRGLIRAEHGIAEGVEAVPLLDREPVEPARLLDPREGHHEGEQRRARQVEVRQERVDAAELEARRDEQLGAAGERPAAGERLEHAHRRRADGEDALGCPDPLPRLPLDLVALAVDLVLLESAPR